MGNTRNADQRADAAFARQWGVITLQQAFAFGLTPEQIRVRVRSGRWTRAGRGTYIAAASADCWQRDLMVACLAGPEGTVASHVSAAALFGLLDPPTMPHVTVPRGSSGRLGSARVHFRDLAEEDRTSVGTIPSAMPARLLADCAEILGEEALNNLVDDVLYQGLTSPAKLEAAIDRWGR
jgi:hypothetical protein